MQAGPEPWCAYKDSAECFSHIGRTQGRAHVKLPSCTSDQCLKFSLASYSLILSVFLHVVHTLAGVLDRDLHTSDHFPEGQINEGRPMGEC